MNNALAANGEKGNDNYYLNEEMAPLFTCTLRKRIYIHEYRLCFLLLFVPLHGYHVFNFFKAVFTR